LFAKNFAVLVEMVKMWQDLPLTNEARDQFLGDLFEMLLDQGVKQSEGQFFTPLPIVRFIVSSLPLGKIVSQDKSIPKALDYACGAGHFLNEYAAQIGHWVSGPKLSDMFKQIYGIEKESRLAKVSKVAALMYGQNDIQIKFADALTEIDGIKENSFSVLIANPPYSVKGFLETLTDEEKNKFTLSRTVNNISTNSSIECFFIERAAQLLKTGGVAGIVLPSTVLTKSNEAVYSEAQKILLKNFDIIAVFDAGTGVFGKTGTQTVTLFLRKKSNEPNLFEHYTNRVVSWYKSDFKKDELFEDKDKLVQFAHLVIDGDVSEVDKVKCVLSDTKYKKRLVYYLLTRYQSEEVLIIKAPDDNSERKKFLGYEWTKRKGSEGIQYLSDRNDVGSIETPMFDPGNLFDLTDKLNGLIRDNFNRKLNITEIPESLRQFVTVTPLSQLLNFKDDSFKTAIYLNNARFDDGGPQIRWNTEYQLVKLSTVITECPKSLISVRDAEENTSGQYPFYTSGINIYRYDKHLVDGENLYIADGGKFSCHYYKGKAAYSSHTYVIKAKDNTIMNKYLYILLNQNAQFITDNYFTGSGLKNLQKQKFATFLIPLPPIEIQQKIVGEYEKIEQQQSAAQQNIENANSRMSSIMDEISGGGGNIFLMPCVTIFLRAAITQKKNQIFGQKFLNTQYIRTGKIVTDFMGSPRQPEFLRTA
jgi:restriction endonuclease S subunit